MELHTYRPIRWAVFSWLLSLGATFVHPCLAQSHQRLLFVGITPGLGIGSYNGVGPTVGIDLRYQHLLKDNWVLTAKTGIEALRIKGRYAEQFQRTYQTASGLSLPITVGVRRYFLDRLHADLNVGADIGVSALTITSFRFEPMVGMMIPLSRDNYLDIGSSVVTSFGRGSGIYLFSFAYGLKLK